MNESSSSKQKNKEIEKEARAFTLEEYKTLGDHVRTSLIKYYESKAEFYTVRKALLIATSFSLAISYTTVLPNSIDLLGIKTQDIPHVYIYLLLSVFTSYFGVHFSVVRNRLKRHFNHLQIATGKRSRIKSVLTKRFLNIWEIQQLKEEFELEYMLPVKQIYAGQKINYRNTDDRDLLHMNIFDGNLPIFLSVFAVLFSIYRAFELI